MFSVSQGSSVLNHLKGLLSRWCLDTAQGHMGCCIPLYCWPDLQRNLCLRQAVTVGKACERCGLILRAVLLVSSSPGPPGSPLEEALLPSAWGSTIPGAVLILASLWIFHLSFPQHFLYWNKILVKTFLNSLPAHELISFFCFRDMSYYLFYFCTHNIMTSFLPSLSSLQTLAHILPCSLENS